MKKYLPVAGTFCLSRTHKVTIPYKYKRQTESRSKRNRSLHLSTSDKPRKAITIVLSRDRIKFHLATVNNWNRSAGGFSRDNRSAVARRRNRPAITMGSGNLGWEIIKHQTK